MVSSLCLYTAVLISHEPKNEIEPYLDCTTPSYKLSETSLTVVTGSGHEECGTLNLHYCLPYIALSKYININNHQKSASHRFLVSHPKQR